MKVFDLNSKYLSKPLISEHKDRDVIWTCIGVEDSVANDESLRVFDEKGDLVLIHYLENHTSDVNHVHGLVIDVKKAKVVAGAFPYTEEMMIGDVNGRLEYEVATMGYEGTVVRLYYTDEWMLSTHKKLDARRSRWAGPTFGEIFDSANIDLDALDKDMCYAYMLTHPENRLVCDCKETQVRLLAVFTGVEFDLAPSNQQLAMSEVEAYLTGQKKIDITRYTGVITCSENKCVRYVSEEYMKKRNIRGNEPNVKLRYLQLRIDEKSDEKVSMLRKLFPEKEEVFDMCDNAIDILSAYLFECYERRYVKNEFIKVPQEDFHIMKMAHVEDDQSVMDRIKRELGRSNARQINAMLNHMKFYNQKKNE
jgi:hypothetical protein